MIVFDLQCDDGCSTFEAWFRSSADYDEQRAGGLVQCPMCLSSNISKAPMAPRLPKKGVSPLAELAAIQAEVLKSSRWVGDEFTQTARAMHSGEMEPQQADYGHTMVYSPDAEARKLVETPALGRALLVGGGKRTVLSGARVLVGRSRDCDVVLDDPNVSRRHAELRRQGDTWMVADLGSTNGVKVNGRRVQEQPLSPGDEITLGIERLTFEVE